ncbi:hypothetical protein AVEN_176527-1 [Araneus ventricosus]|uniref:Uncharacterized protein n=1 Tax=Araneus ventricosus TaxID=182803 RepID=A0A4Y2EQR7_ARAVE|nr:hypothetical protein AVEN_176527-1 [Araneus ventricosus]
MFFLRQEIRKAINYSTEEFVSYSALWPSVLSENRVTWTAVCKQQSRIFYQGGGQQNDQWAFVVNDVDYIQTVMAEICENSRMTTPKVWGSIVDKEMNYFSPVKFTQSLETA